MREERKVIPLDDLLESAFEVFTEYNDSFGGWGYYTLVGGDLVIGFDPCEDWEDAAFGPTRYRFTLVEDDE